MSGVVEELGAYLDFLATKIRRFPRTGHEPRPLPDILFPFQNDVTRWAVRKGRACIFADTGLGKTFMQLAWAADVVRETGGRVLLLAPLAVSHQTHAEARRLGIEAKVCKTQDECSGGITVTNYERLHNFEPASFVGVVLDESSILKSHDSKTRNKILSGFRATRYRLACTATPAPNDFMELGNHAEFVGAMTRSEMLSMFFVHDGGETQKWRLKRHAQDLFWRWVATWACVIRKPSDLGYEDGSFELPELIKQTHVVRVQEVAPSGMLFASDRKDLMGRRRARRNSITERVRFVADLVAEEPDEQWILWCDLNDESGELTRLVPGAVEVKGSDSSEHKEKSLLAFAAGRIRVLVSKPSICGFGMNFQSCACMAFVGLSDSFESLYQAIRRCWRYGQTREVHAHLVIGSSEGDVLRNLERKEEEARVMSENVSRLVQSTVADENVETDPVAGNGTGNASGNGWVMIHGDCVEGVTSLESSSIDYSVFSPPFASLYTYSDSERDMGNCDTDQQFMEHFRFLVEQLLRVTKPGRLCSFHCMNLPSVKVRDGFIGIRDFRGELIRMYQAVGWIFHSEVVIWKDPVTAMQRTKALGLLHKQLRKDSAMSRQGIPDYVVTMRKPGENPDPISHTPDEFPVSLWQRWASPVWDDINPSDTLQFRSAREQNDERHICPLQLEVIRRCLGLWTRPGDLVISPFAGIGSEGFEAIKHDRRFMGWELKASYFKQACANLRNAEREKSVGLFT